MFNDPVKFLYNLQITSMFGNHVNDSNEFWRKAKRVNASHLKESRNGKPKKNERRAVKMAVPVLIHKCRL